MICLAAALFYCVQEGERNRETTVDKEAVNGGCFENIPLDLLDAHCRLFGYLVYRH